MVRVTTISTHKHWPMLNKAKPMSKKRVEGREVDRVYNFIISEAQRLGTSEEKLSKEVIERR